MKRISMASLLIAVALALVLFGGADSTAESRAGKQAVDSAVRTVSETKESDTTATTPEVIAYYFRTTVRCASCKKIEAYSKEAIETGFGEELKNGTLKFESINIQEDKNRHFIEDYQLYTKSVVICDMKDGKQVQWKNLDKVWRLVGSKDQFINYVQNEISAYLKED